MHACKPLWQRIAGIVPSGGFFFVEMTTALFRFLCRSFLLSVLTLCRLPFPPSLTLLFLFCHPSFPSVSLFVLTILNNLCNLIHSFFIPHSLSFLAPKPHSLLSFSPSSTTSAPHPHSSVYSLARCYSLRSRRLAVSRCVLL